MVCGGMGVDRTMVKILIQSNYAYILEKAFVTLKIQQIWMSEIQL